jgi:hypothetical protein
MIVVKFIVRDILSQSKNILLTEENSLPSVPTCGSIEQDLENFRDQCNFKAIYTIARKTFKQVGDDLFLVFELLVIGKPMDNFKWVGDDFILDSANAINPIDRFFLLNGFHHV